MAIYQMALMGGAAAGAVLWGQVAGLSSVRIAVLGAAAVGPAAVAADARACRWKAAPTPTSAPAGAAAALPEPAIDDRRPTTAR